MDTRASTPQSDAEFASRLQAEEARAAGGAGADAVISMLNQFAAQAHARNAGLTLNAAALPVVTPRRNGTVAGNRGSWIEAATKTSPAMIIFATLVAMPQLVGIVWVLARTQCQYDDPKAHRNGLDRTCDSPLGIWLVLYAARLVAHLAVLWVLAVGHSMHVRRRVGAAARAEAGEETAASANPAASATQTAAPRQTRRYARVGEDEDEEEEQGVDVEQPAGTGREGDAARDVAVNAAVAANEAALRRTSHGACTTILIYAAGLKGARRSFLAIMTIIFTYFDDDNFYINSTTRNALIRVVLRRNSFHRVPKELRCTVPLAPRGVPVHRDVQRSHCPSPLRPRRCPWSSLYIHLHPPALAATLRDGAASDENRDALDGKHERIYVRNG